MKSITEITKKIWLFILCIGLFSGCSLQTANSQPAGGTTAAGTTTASGTTTAISTQTIKTSTSNSDTQAVSGPEFPEGAIVSRRLLGTINSLNPHQAGLSSEEDLEKYLVGSLYLAAGNPASGKLEFVPYHAQSLPASADGMIYTISLRQGLTWSDGSNLTAEDYVNSMKLLLDPKLNNPIADRFSRDLGILNAAAYQSGSLADFSQVGFKALDGNTLELRLEQTADAFNVDSILSTPFLVNSKLYEEGLTKDRNQTAYGLDYKKMLYSGPYEMEKYEKGQYIRLRERKGSVLDSLNQIYYTADYITQTNITDKTKALEAFLGGSLDLVPISGSAYKLLADDPRVKVEPSNTVWGLYANTQTPGAAILSDKNFRKALYYGVDRSAIAVTMFGSYNSSSGFIGPLSLVGDPAAPEKYRKTAAGKASVPEANVYNITEAEKFAEAALKAFADPQSIEITIPSGDEQLQDMAKFLKVSWEDLFPSGRVVFTIRELPLTEAYRAYKARDYDLGFGAMGQEIFDPWRSLAVFTRGYPGKFDTMANARFDELQQSSTRGVLKSDPAGKLAALKEMEDILLDELPQIPLFANSSAYLISDRLTLPFAEAIPGYGLGLDMAAYKK